MASQIQNCRERSLNEVNRFTKETSIHGFTFVSRSHPQCTRLIWVALLAVAIIIATFMINQNLRDAETHPLSTTLDTVSVTEIPFPAITLHPGSFRSENALFKRTFDYIQFERYKENDELRNNSEFLSIWKSTLKQGIEGTNWISLFIEKIMFVIKKDPKFNRKKRMMRNVAAIVAALYKQDKQIAKTIEDKVMDAILSNMFKYTGFSEVNEKWVQGILVPIIEEAKKTFNITEEEITNCKKKACDKIREKYELLGLSPLYIFMDSARVGAGTGEGVGAGHFLAKFSIDQASKQFKKDFTDAINYGTGGSLPQTVFSYEKLFTDWLNQPGNMAVHEMMKRTKGYTKAGPYFKPFYEDHPRSECNIASYFGFWYAYIYWGGKVVLKCPETEGEDFICNQETKMTQVVNLNEQFLCATKSCKKVIILQRNPCQEHALAQQYGFSACCNFNKNISSNRAAMLKVLKFSIQSPHLSWSLWRRNFQFSLT